LNYARRQQYRRLSRAGRAAAGSVTAALLALVVGDAGAALLAGLLLLTAFGLGLSTCHWLALAGRSRVGARSEDDVQRSLTPLRAEGWRLRHSLPWQGGGDIDSVAIAPTGIAIAIETKTRTYEARHLARVREQAAWLSRRRRRWARNGALGIMCLVRARGIERVEHDVLVVSIDRLTHVLRAAAGIRPDPPPAADRRVRGDRASAEGGGLSASPRRAAPTQSLAENLRARCLEVATSESDLFAAPILHSLWHGFALLGTDGARGRPDPWRSSRARAGKQTPSARSNAIPVSRRRSGWLRAIGSSPLRS